MKSLHEITGLNLSDIDAAYDYYDARREKIPGAPKFSDDVLPWLKYMDNVREGETWDALIDRMKQFLASANRPLNLFLPLFTEDRKGFTLHADRHNALEEECVRWQPEWQIINHDPVVSEIFCQLARLMPLWSYMRTEHEQATADFIWSSTRCLFAGAGWNNHADITRILCDLYPSCPFVENEQQEDWYQSLIIAHKNCGWPIHLGLMPWTGLMRIHGDSEMDNDTLPEWHKVVALLHLLKHVRVTGESGHLVSIFEGAAATYETGGRAVGFIAQFKTVIGDLTRSLKIQPVDGPNPLCRAFRHCLNHIPMSYLLQRVSPTKLPGLVLHGPWSGLLPDPSHKEGFVQHGCRLDGVWVCDGKRIRIAHGETNDIMGYAWNLSADGAPERQEARQRFEAILPSELTPGFASDLFARAFGNWSVLPDWNRDAVHALFDAPIVASIIRTEVPGLVDEFPLIAFLPSVPEQDESTNQGKTLASASYLRMLCPAIERMTKAPETGSAPDNRTVADSIRQHGTIGLDEFQIGKSRSHLLNRDNIQSLCTGGGLAIGKVLENSPGMVFLRHSLVINAKALDIGPDIVNRTIPFFMNRLTDAQRQNPQQVADIKSGRMAMLGRLQTIAKIMEHGIADRIENIGSTNKGMRFDTHRAIAKLLFEIRTGKPDTGEIDATFIQMQTRFMEHTHMADDAGVLTLLEDGSHIRFRLSTFFDELTSEEIENIAAVLAARGVQTRQGITYAAASEVVRARSAIAGLHGQPLCMLMKHLTGSPIRCGDKTIIMAFNKAAGIAAMTGAPWRLPGLLGSIGWHLLLMKHGDRIHYSLRNLIKSPLAEGALE